METQSNNQGHSPPIEPVLNQETDKMNSGVSTSEDPNTHLKNEPPEIRVSDEETDVLIPGSQMNHPSKSHRGLGQGQSSHENSYNSTNDRNNQDRGQSPQRYEVIPGNGDSERYSEQSMRFTIHRDYREFQNKSRFFVSSMVFFNVILLLGVFVGEFFIEFFATASRNESFVNFVLLFIALVGNCFNLWFSDIGLFSPWDYRIDIFLTTIPIFTFFLLSLTSYTRQRMNFLTMFTLGWLVVTFASGLAYSYKLKDYIDKLQGPNSQNKHTVKEWFIIAFRNTSKILMLALLSLITLNTILFTLDTHNTNDLNHYTYADSHHKRSLHINCYGLENSDSQQPIVIYEHGGEDTSYRSGRWIQELFHLGRVDRYCVYDRPGYGLSDSTSAPWSLKDSSEALRYALVEEMKLKGPFTVVGFDYGGLVARTFVSNNRDLCSGLMLIESWHEELLKKKYFSRLFPGDDDGGANKDGSHSDAQLSYRFIEKEIGKRNGFKIWWDGLWSTIGLNSHYSWIGKHRGSKERIFGKDMRHEGKFLRAKFLEIITSSLLSYRDILQSNEMIRNVKLSVVSSKEMIKKSSVWGDWQRQLTKISTNTKEWKIVDGEHTFYENQNGKELTQDVLLRLLGE